MQGDIERILIPQQRIAQRVRELAEQITRDHTPPSIPDGGEITIVQVLTGAFIFCADLIRHIPLPIRIGLLTVSSYPGQSMRTQGARITSEQLGDLRGRHVLLIDDILDSGGTLRRVAPVLRQLQPASLKTCVLLRKDRPDIEQAHADYVGFDIPDAFVVGYGLDFNDYYRNLPDIVTLKREATERAMAGQEMTGREPAGHPWQPNVGAAEEMR